MAGISRNVIIIIIIAGLLIVGIQVWGNIEISRHSEEILKQLESLPQDQLANEKARQEVIALRIETETKALFWTGLIGSVGTLVAVFAALIGLWEGLRDYWANREKERLDRAATDLNSMWEGMANSDARVRAGAIVGLQHYLTPDKCEYHLRILSALVVAARLEKDPEVLSTITTTIQQGILQVSWEISHKISWQRVNLKHINLKGQKLSGFDFRDANLEDADLQDCDLSGARFNAANLKGARLDRACLAGANLEYADLAGASLVQADLTECNLDNVKVLNADLKEANLLAARFNPEEITWKLTKNWRHAKLDTALYNRLITQYGPVAGGPKVLMMIWEYPPLAVGGAWTAAYHIIRNLRKQGADLVVMVPWKRSLLNMEIFGNEVELISLEIVPPAGSSPGIYGRASVYGLPYSVYGSCSPYHAPYSAYGGYASVYNRDARLIRQGPISGLVKEFQQRTSRYIQRESTKFDIVYASDWPTFWAAQEVSRTTGKPWIAHFHSTEHDRRSENPDPDLVSIEQHGAESAEKIITPSNFTAGEIVNQYKVLRSKITVIPNPLSKDDIPVSESGSFDTKRIVFIGRLARQKGPDLFVKICSTIKHLLPVSSFIMFGSGEEQGNIREQIRKLKVDVSHSEFGDWESRGSAFGNASVLLVTSRAEPFGMVILEGMERGIPVLYPQTAGAAEVLPASIQINPEDTDGTAEKVRQLLSDKKNWKEVVEAQNAMIRAYYSRSYEMEMLRLFSEVSGRPLPGSLVKKT